MSDLDFIVLLKPPSDQRLTEDVEALWADPDVLELIAAREFGPRIQVTLEGLQRAWLELDESYRRLIRVRHLIGPMFRPSPKRLGAALGTTPGKALSATERGFNELHELVQSNRGFHDLDPPVRQIIQRIASQAGQPANPTDLPNFIDLVVEARGLTKPRYDLLITWLEDHGHADIAHKVGEALSPGSRMLLGLNEATT